MSQPLAQLLADAARAQPEGIAAEVVGGSALTYRSWHERSDAQASGLSGEGIGAGDRVALLFDTERWTEYAVAYMAVAKVGATAVPLSADLSSLEIIRAVRTTAVRAVIAPDGLGPAELHVRRLDPALLQRDGAAHLPDRQASGEVSEILVRSHPLMAPVLRIRSAATITAGAALPFEAAGADGGLLHWWPIGSSPGQDALCAALQPHGVGSIVLPAYEPAEIQRALAGGRVTACSLHPALAEAMYDSTGPGWVRDLRGVILVSGRVSPELRQHLAGTDPAVRVLVAAADEPATDDGQAGDAAPAAASQEGMVWHESFAPGCQNLPGLARRFRGDLDVGILGRALDEIVRRHEPLRSTFAVEGGRLKQIVHPPRVVGARRIDLSSLPPERREAEVERLVAEAGLAPFDLVDGPLFEASVVRMADKDHVLVIRTHHSVFDDWSVGVFRRQLATLYEAYASGSEQPEWDSSNTFSGFAREQRSALESAAGADELRFWAGELHDAPLSTQLPVQDRGAPAGATQPTGGPVTITLPAEVSAALRALAREERATVFMLLLAAFGAVVSRRTGQEDLLLSTVVANRNRTELERLIGCFTKKVPLRLDLRGDPEFTQMVARTRRTLLGVLHHQDLPFETVIQGVLGPRAEGHGLVPNVVVVVQGVTPRQELLIPDVQSAGFETSDRAARAHFMAATGARASRGPWGGGIYLGTFVILSVSGGDELSCTARGAFDGTAVEALLEDVANVVAQASVAPWRRLSELISDLPPWTPDARGGVDLDGFRIDTEAIASALSDCPGVLRADVHASENEAGAPEIVADIVPDGMAPSPDTLRTFLWSRMPGYAWPAFVRIAGAPSEAGPAHPIADTALLGAFWSEVLGVERCRPDANYWQDFSFLEALARARDAGVRVPGPLITRNRTLRTLATAVAAERAGSAA